MRDALASALSRDPLIRIAATGATAEEAVAAVSVEALDIVILDLNMPGGGVEAATGINRLSPATRVIMFTSQDDAQKVDAALTAGAWAFLVKGTPIAGIRAALRDVHKGKVQISPSLASRLLGFRPSIAPWSEDENERPFDLLEREEQILLRLSQGLSSTEIGEAIGLSPDTVEAFMSNIIMKLHASQHMPVK